MPIIQERDRIEIQKRLEAMEKPVKPEAYFLERILLTLEEGKTTAIPGLAESPPSILPKGGEVDRFSPPLGGVRGGQPTHTGNCLEIKVIFQ